MRSYPRTSELVRLLEDPDRLYVLSVFARRPWGLTTEEIATACDVDESTVEQVAGFLAGINAVKRDVDSGRWTVNTDNEFMKSFARAEIELLTEGETLDQYLHPGAPFAEPDVLRQRDLPDDGSGYDEALAELEDLPAVSWEVAEILYEGGYTSVEDVRNATAADLVAVEGISNIRAVQIKDGLDGDTGPCVGVFDPKGDDVERLLESIPHRRIDDLVFIDPKKIETQTPTPSEADGELSFDVLRYNEENGPAVFDELREILDTVWHPLIDKLEEGVEEQLRPEYSTTNNSDTDSDRDRDTESDTL